MAQHSYELPRCFPGGTHPSSALPISVEAEQLRAGVDFELSDAPGRSIRGHLAGLTGDARLKAQLWSRNVPPGQQRILIDQVDVAEAGQFEFANVPPGEFVVSVLHYPDSVDDARVLWADGSNAHFSGVPFARPATKTGGPSELTSWGETPVSVERDDVVDVLVILQYGSPICGHLVFDGTAEMPRADELRDQPIMVLGDGEEAGEIPLARVRADGSFCTVGLRSGRYELSLLGNISSWHVYQVMAQGRDVTDQTIELGSTAITDFAIHLGDKNTTLRGSVRTPLGEALADWPVAVFPSDPRLWSSDSRRPSRLRMARTNADGGYAFVDLIPGRYRIVVLKPSEVSDWTLRENLVRLSSKSQETTLGLGASVLLNITAARQ